MKKSVSSVYRFGEAFIKERSKISTPLFFFPPPEVPTLCFELDGILGTITNLGMDGTKWNKIMQGGCVLNIMMPF